jgi:hypothetical protein
MERADLIPALTDALDLLCRGDVAVEQAIPVPGWQPSPGATDIALRHGRPFRAVIEAKVYKLDWCLWDMVKVASLVAHGSAEAGYLVVAAPTQRFATLQDMAELFQGTTTLDTVDLFTRYERAWIDLLGGGSARPMSLPGRLRTHLIASHKLTALPKWELRTLRVCPLRSKEVQFVGGWPIGHWMSTSNPVNTKETLLRLQAARQDIDGLTRVQAPDELLRRICPGTLLEKLQAFRERTDQAKK